MHLKPSITQLLLMGLAGTLIVGIGEWLLHFNVNGYTGEIEMVENVPLARAGKGHYLVVLGIPLYFAGYDALMRIFQSSNDLLAKVLFVAGIFSFAVGGTHFHSLRPKHIVKGFGHAEPECRGAVPRHMNPMHGRGRRLGGDC